MKLLPLLTLLFLSVSIFSQTSERIITGTVYDQKGETIPFVNIIIKGTQKGTASNYNGHYYFAIKSNEIQELVFSSVGFKDTHIDLTKRTENKIDIVLKAEDILLKNVTINAKAKDPAYAIIKQAIAKRKFHLKQVKSYQSDVYLKSTLRFDELPSKIPFVKPEDMPDSTDLGLVYLSESSSKAYYQAPNKFKEIMYASSVAGQSEGYSFNTVSSMRFNFYKNNIEVNISDKLFLSPIASSALVLYRYEYQGTLYENGNQIHKIKVRPRIKGDPLFHGDIYINDSLWSIHSLDLTLTKDAQFKFFKNLNFKQSFIEIDNIWIPRSTNLTSEIKFFGLGATFNSAAIFNDYDLNKSFDKKFFTNEVFTLNKESNQKDSSYWVDNRPVSLTDEEKKNYHVADSIETVENSPEYRDSIRKLYNQNGIGDIISDGYYYQFKSDSSWIYTSSLLNGIGFNTVEGWNGKLDLSYTKLAPQNKRYNIDIAARYGFEIKDWGAKIDAAMVLNSLKFESINFSVGKYIDNLNESNFNMWYSLLAKRNYQKINQKTFAKINYQREVFNGLRFYSDLEIASRKYLTNHSSLSWTNTSRSYTPNFPVINNDITPIDHNQITAAVSFRYTFNQKYAIYPDEKYIEPSKLPVLTGKYKVGYGMSNKETGYQFVSFRVNQNLKLGQIGNLTYNATVGKFFNSDNMQFWDYKHFNGNQTQFITPTAEAFETLPYFSHSTNKEYAEIHVLHQFNGFIMSKIPLIRKLRWQSLAGINSVINPTNNYHELYFGIENIFKFLRVDFAGAIGNDKKFTPAVRIGLDIGL